MLYLSRTYGCKPVLSEIDTRIDAALHDNPTRYVSSVLDRENIQLALLDLLGHKDVEPPFPRGKFGLLFCPTKTILNPVWAMEHGSTNLDETLKLCEEEIKDVERRKFSGFKCEIAYFRTLQISDVGKDQANKAYRALRRTKPVDQDLWETVPIYRRSSDKHNLETYQDFMMRYLMSKAGDLGVHVQFHTGCGLGPHPNLSQANPTLLYELLMDDAMKRTKVVLLHTGYPFVEEAALMAAQFPNVYIDISVLLLFHGAYKQSLRTILEFVPPQRILYSSDAITFSELYAYHGWFIKNALKETLTEFIASHSWTEERCMEVAEMILNKNAKHLEVRRAV
jgi:predicted TIM-barrel fold metal-dependent hydrolase